MRETRLSNQGLALVIGVSCAVLHNGGSCNKNVYVPPSRVPPAAAHETAGAGKSMVVGQLSSHELADIFDTGPSYNGFGGGFRHGLRDDLDLELDGSWSSVGGTDESNFGQSTRVISGRAGLKKRMRRAIAFHGGLGGGSAPASGEFVSADVGLVAAADFGTISPWVGVSVYGSAPLGADDIQVDIDEVDAVRPTLGLTGSAGLRIGRKDYLGLGLFFSSLSTRNAENKFVGAAISLTLRWPERDSGKTSTTGRSSQ